MVDKIVNKNAVMPKSVAKAAPVPPSKTEAPKPPFAAPVAAKVEAPKPVAAAPMPKPVMPKPVIAKPAVAAAPVAAAPTPVHTPEPIKASIIEKGKTVMNDTINQAQDAVHNFTANTTERATEMFGDVTARAKTAMEKGSKSIEDLVEFSKGNLEAVVASGRVAAKGAQDIAKYSAEYGRKSIEDANATAKRFAAVKSPTEFFALQSEVAKSQLDALVGEASKFTENYMKLLGEMVQPVQNRYAVAVEKVKTAVAA